ncbi:hypothetical protein FRB95_009690 [Tulasnella sp. JGI-2019a]|nr:hypothetical protein FRB95_009690 [Tulasnella sp. JGI-2019a]
MPYSKDISLGLYIPSRRSSIQNYWGQLHWRGYAGTLEGIPHLPRTSSAIADICKEFLKGQTDGIIYDNDVTDATSGLDVGHGLRQFIKCERFTQSEISYCKS